MKGLAFILFQFLVTVIYGQRSDTISMFVFYVINSDTATTYSEEAIPAHCEFSKYIRYKVATQRNRLTETSLSEIDTFYLTAPLIIGQYENSRKSGIWFYYNDINCPNDNDFGSKRGYGIQYQLGKVILFDDDKRSNYSITFNNDSSIIKGFVVNMKISKTIDFECNEQGNCQFWIETMKQEIILNGYKSEFVDLFYIAQNGVMKNGALVGDFKTTPKQE